MTSTPRPPLLTAVDISAELQCGLATAYRLIRFMKSTKLGRLVRVRRADFEAYIEKNAIESADGAVDRARSTRVKPTKKSAPASSTTSTTKPGSSPPGPSWPSGVPPIKIALPRTKLRAGVDLPR